MAIVACLSFLDTKEFAALRWLAKETAQPLDSITVLIPDQVATGTRQ
jgi:hypothetical protein